MSHSADWLTAFEALKSVYADGAYSNMALNEAIPRHPGCRDSFVRNFVKETIRQTITLDHIIGLLASNGLKGIRTRTLIILRMGICAIREMDSVPDHAAVSEAVSLARKTARGTDGFINAVMRSYLRRREEFEVPHSGHRSHEDEHGEPVSPDLRKEAAEAPFIADIKDPCRRLSVKYSMPEDITRLIAEQYGEEAEQVLDGLNKPPALVLRVNTLRISRDELALRLRDLGIRTEPAEESERALIAGGGSVIGTELYRKGLFSVQSLSSISAVEALAPAPGSTVLDMCAAPGGKSVMMAEMMENRGRITACDIHEHRLDLIRASAERTGAGIIETRLADGTEHDSSMDEMFDYVLADVPCSGLGVMSTKPEIRLRADVSSYSALTDIQLEILKNAFRYAKPGGRICYSTCTINREENDGVVARFTEWLSEGSCRFAHIVEINRLLPYNNVIGFYYCIIEKNA